MQVILYTAKLVKSIVNVSLACANEVFTCICRCGCCLARTASGRMGVENCMPIHMTFTIRF